MNGLMVRIALLAVMAVLGGCASLIDPLDRQIASVDAENVLSVQGYLVRENAAGQELVARWEDLADLMRRQPGFVSARLGEGTGESSFWFAWSEWQDANALRDAFADPEILAVEARMPDRLFGHLYERRRQVLPVR